MRKSNITTYAKQFAVGFVVSFTLNFVAALISRVIEDRQDNSNGLLRL